MESRLTWVGVMLCVALLRGAPPAQSQEPGKPDTAPSADTGSSAGGAAQGAPEQAPAAELPPIGRAIAVEGDVLVVPVGQEKPLALKQGDRTHEADRIETSESGRVRLILTDNSILVLSTNAVLELSAVDVDEARGTRATVVNLIEGTVRVIIPDLKDHKQRFEVRTPASKIQARAGHLIVRVIKEQNTTHVLLVDGKATVASSDPLVTGMIALTTMEMTEIREGQPASIGHVPADDDLKDLKELTEVRFNTDVVSRVNPLALTGPVSSGTPLARQALMEDLTSPTRSLPESPEGKLDPTKGTIEINWGK